MAMWWERVRFTVTCSMDKLRNFCHQKRNQRPASLLKTPRRFHQCLHHLLTPVSNFPLFVPTGVQEPHRKLAQTSEPARMQEDNVEPCGPPCPPQNLPKCIPLCIYMQPQENTMLTTLTKIDSEEIKDLT